MPRVFSQPQMSWKEPGWRWGDAQGKAHEEAKRLRSSLSTREQRQSFLTGIGMMDPEDWQDAKVVLALNVQRASKFSNGGAYGMDRDEQTNWRALMDDMAACRFEGYRGDLLLAEAIMERLGLSESKRIASL